MSDKHTLNKFIDDFVYIRDDCGCGKLPVHINGQPYKPELVTVHLASDKDHVDIKDSNHEALVEKSKNLIESMEQIQSMVGTEDDIAQVAFCMGELEQLLEQIDG